MSYFSNIFQKKDPLPQKYIDFISSHLNDVESIINEGGIGKEPASVHKKALNSLIIGKPYDSIKLLEKADTLYKNIDISESSPKLIKCKGDCLLHGIIIDNVYEQKYNIQSFKPDAVSAFTYLWISVEMSHYKLLESLKSISELFCFFADGVMITAAGGVQSMPPTHFPEYFSIVSEYFIIMFGGIELRSLGNPSEKRHLMVSNPEIVPIDSERESFLINQIKLAQNRIDILTNITNEKYRQNISSGKAMQQAIMKPVSENDTTSYFDFFEIMIRNLKRMKSENIYFKQIPVSFDEAYNNENQHLLYSIIYSGMYYGGNKKSYEEVSIELYNLAHRFNKDLKYGTANLIINEAKFFNPNNDEIDEFIRKNGEQFVAYEEKFWID